MILLDTDHLSVLRGDPNARRDRLVARLTTSNEDLGTTVISLEEQMRGWLAAVAKERHARRQVTPYDELIRLIHFFAEYNVLRFDEAAADHFDTLSRVKIGTGDRKIAAITITANALLLTANRRDFERVPGLRFENWMD